MHNKNSLRLVLITAFLFMLTAKSAFGQVGGCVDSPEDPTAILALLGCGALAVPVLRARLLNRKRPK